MSQNTAAYRADPFAKPCLQWQAVAQRENPPKYIKVAEPRSGEKHGLLCDNTNINTFIWLLDTMERGALRNTQLVSTDKLLSGNMSL